MSRYRVTVINDKTGETEEIVVVANRRDEAHIIATAQQKEKRGWNPVSAHRGSVKSV